MAETGWAGGDVGTEVDVAAVLADLVPELNGLLSKQVRFMAPGASESARVPLPRSVVERMILAVAIRLRNSVGAGGWMLAGVDRVTLCDWDAGQLGLRAGDHVIVRIAAHCGQRALASLVAAGLTDAMADGLGGGTMRTLGLLRVGAVRLEAVPRAGITATLYLRSAPSDSPSQAPGRSLAG